MSTTLSHRAAIRTRFYGPTNTLGARVVAWRADEKSPNQDPAAVRLSWDHALDVAENHRAAIDAYIEAHNEAGHDWAGQWVVGAMEDGFVATWAGRDER